MLTSYKISEDDFLDPNHKQTKTYIAELDFGAKKMMIFKIRN